MRRGLMIGVCIGSCTLGLGSVVSPSTYHPILNPSAAVQSPMIAESEVIGIYSAAPVSLELKPNYSFKYQVMSCLGLIEAQGSWRLVDNTLILSSSRRTGDVFHIDGEWAAFRSGTDIGLVERREAGQRLIRSGR